VRARPRSWLITALFTRSWGAGAPPRRGIALARFGRQALRRGRRRRAVAGPRSSPARTHGAAWSAGGSGAGHHRRDRLDAGVNGAGGRDPRDGADPVQKLVLPRVLAATVALPLLTVLANVLGIVGGMPAGLGPVRHRPELLPADDHQHRPSMDDFVSGDFLKTFFLRRADRAGSAASRAAGARAGAPWASVRATTLSGGGRPRSACW